MKRFKKFAFAPKTVHGKSKAHMLTHHRSSNHSAADSGTHTDWWTEKDLRADRATTSYAHFAAPRPEPKSGSVWLTCCVLVGGVIALVWLAKYLLIG